MSNPNLKHLHDYLKSHKLPYWNYAAGDPFPIFPILFPEVYGWYIEWECTYVKGAEDAPLSTSASFFGLTKKQFDDLFAYMEIQDESNQAWHYPTQEEFLKEMEKYIT